MKKIFLTILSCLFAFTLFGCSSSNNQTNDESFEETDPISYTEDEQTEDENYNNLKDLNKKLILDDIIGSYDAVIYTVFGYPFINGTDEWNDIFEETETFGIKILDKEHLEFDALEGNYTCKYTLEGNVITIFIESDVDEENAPIEGVIIDDCIVLDLDGSKVYLVSEKSIEDALTIAQDILYDIQPDLEK